ncbi:unnamed protein product, partial [Prorocentrum cordatum]
PLHACSAWISGSVLLLGLWPVQTVRQSGLRRRGQAGPGPPCYGEVRASSDAQQRGRRRRRLGQGRRRRPGPRRRLGRRLRRVRATRARRRRRRRPYLEECGPGPGWRG